MLDQLFKYLKYIEIFNGAFQICKSLLKSLKILQIISRLSSRSYNSCNCQIPVWPENLTGIKFDEIASKLHNKNMTDFKFDEMPGKKAHSIRKINIDGY